MRIIRAMSIAKKIERWQAANLLTPSQAQAIHAYEKTHKGGRFMTGLIGVAVFAILCGILSVIAANWMNIPGGVKLGAHLVLNMIIACALYRTGRPIYREGLCLLLFGLTLTLIALTGQVFQLGSGWANALILWLVITAPLMLVFGQTRITAVPWILAFLATIAIACEEYLQGSFAFRDTIILIGLMIFLPLALIADGNLGIMKQYKPVWGRLFVGAGFTLLLACASLSSVLWYKSLADEYYSISLAAGWHYGAMHMAVSVLCLLALGAHVLYAAIKKSYHHDAGEKAAAQIAVLATIFFMAPLATTVEGGSPAAALHVIIFWLAVGYIAQRQGWNRLVTLAIIILTARILIVYFELFGDLMTTGYALISGGIILLALIWGSVKLNRHLKGKADAAA